VQGVRKQKITKTLQENSMNLCTDMHPPRIHNKPFESILAVKIHCPTHPPSPHDYYFLRLPCQWPPSDPYGENICMMSAVEQTNDNDNNTNDKQKLSDRSAKQKPKPIKIVNTLIPAPVMDARS